MTLFLTDASDKKVLSDDDYQVKMAKSLDPFGVIHKPCEQIFGHFWPTFMGNFTYTYVQLVNPPYSLPCPHGLWRPPWGNKPKTFPWNTNTPLNNIILKSIEKIDFNIIYVCPQLQQVINLIGPHLLPDEDDEYINTVNGEDYPVSVLDANVFRSRSRAFKKSDEWN